MNKDRRLVDHGADPFEAALLRSARRDGASAKHQRTLAALGLLAGGVCNCPRRPGSILLPASSSPRCPIFDRVFLRRTSSWHARSRLCWPVRRRSSSPRCHVCYRRRIAFARALHGERRDCLRPLRRSKSRPPPPRGSKSRPPPPRGSKSHRRRPMRCSRRFRCWIARGFGSRGATRPAHSKMRMRISPVFRMGAWQAKRR